MMMMISALIRKEMILKANIFSIKRNCHNKHAKLAVFVYTHTHTHTHTLSYKLNQIYFFKLNEKFVEK